MSVLTLNFDDEFIQEIRQTTQQQGISIESYFKQLFYRQKKPNLNTNDDETITNEDVDNFLAKIDEAKRKDMGKPPFWADWSKEDWGSE